MSDTEQGVYAMTLNNAIQSISKLATKYVLSTIYSHVVVSRLVCHATSAGVSSHCMDSDYESLCTSLPVWSYWKPNVYRSDINYLEHGHVNPCNWINLSYHGLSLNLTP